ncbi:MAG: hypothetical protein MMC23_009033 [Stictis urceolatum]|nr:hypothetical protein [Stictis urceolata]
MSDKDRVYIALYSRQGISLVHSQRDSMKHAAYHWAIYTESKHSQGTGQSYDVADEDSYVNIPGSGGWKYRYSPNVSRVNSRSMLGMLMIGKLPLNVTTAQLNQLMKEIPLPQEDKEPLQNCVSWTREAIGRLQQHGCAEVFDIESFMDDALAQADDWLQRKQSLGAVRLNYTKRKFP